MNIAIFIPKLYGGGAETHFVRLVPQLLRFHRIDLYVIDSSKVPLVTHPNLFVHVLPSKSSKFSSLVSIFLGAFHYLRSINRAKPDVSIVVLKNPCICVSMWMRLFKRDYKTVFNIQNSLKPPLTSILSLRYLLERFLLSAFVSNNDYILTISSGLKGELSRLFPKMNIHYIHNIGLPEDAPLQPKKQFNKKERNDVFEIISIGRLVQQKDYITLFRALSLLPSRLNYKLTILGSGPLLFRLSLYAKSLCLLERINFQGFEKCPSQFLSKSDLFVLSSRWEGFGNVIVEAMSFGLPVIASDCPHGPGEIISSGSNGLLFKPNDPYELSDLILYAYDNYDICNTLGAAAFLRAQDFCAKSIASSYLSYLDALFV